MMQKVWIIAIILLVMIDLSIAQDKKVSFYFEPQYQGKKLFESVSADQEVLLNISRFRWYLSNFELLKDGKVVWALSKKHHYMDAQIASTMTITFEMPEAIDYDVLKFNLGIDSMTNVSGAMGGDLDPTKGMYWAWNSGYINLKLEGTHPLCPARKHKFQYHLGGYSGKMNSLQTIQLPVTTQHVIIDINLDAFFEAIDLTKVYQIMSPSLQAVALSKLAASLFGIRHEKF